MFSGEGIAEQGEMGILPIHKWVVLPIEFIKDWDMLVMKNETRLEMKRFG